MSQLCCFLQVVTFLFPQLLLKVVCLSLQPGLRMGRDREAMWVDMEEFDGYESVYSAVCFQELQSRSHNIK